MNTKKAGGNNNGAGGEDDDHDKENGHSNNNCSREEVKLRYTLGKGMNLEVEFWIKVMTIMMNIFTPICGLA